MRSFGQVVSRRLFVVLTAGLVAAAGTLLALAATQTDIVGPVGSQMFGEQVVALPNGNIVVADPFYDAPGPITNTGAVYLYNGATGALISRLTGSTENDLVGAGRVLTLTNNNFVVISPFWDNGAVMDAGAVTWVNGTTGLTGVVSIANSLVGSTADDQIGSYGIQALSNGNYVVQSPFWGNGAVPNAGAVTWGNGATGITGVVSIANSLVGSTADDRVGTNVAVLSNGNYVAFSPDWDNGATADAGAATWGNGTTGITGAISITNSLVGSAANDQVGNDFAILPNGNYVVLSPNWSNGAATNAGSATWGDGTTGITGVVTIANSLVGGTADDQIGNGNVWTLSNDNYVVFSPNWGDGAAMNGGAVTWGNGTTGITGVVSITNSLVGSTPSDMFFGGIRALKNGNYVVFSPYWDNGSMVQAGAATWGNGTTGITGVVSITNSLVGSTANDRVGTNVAALSNGNYVVFNPDWDNGAVTDAGAATWGNRTTGITGAVSITNSLVGRTASDQVGTSGAALSNGNYVVGSSSWDNGAVANVGAATWGNGAAGITGVVSITNSLVGSAANDQVGDFIMALTNGNYVVQSSFWGNGAVTNAGAATWGNGTRGITGVVSITNSLVGSTANDQVGIDFTALTNGNYVINSFFWANGTALRAGAVTWGNGTTGITGAVTITNSLAGSTLDDRVGSGGSVTALSDGNYVVSSPGWNNGVGAMTLGDGRKGTVGPITANNSVRGSSAGGGMDLNFDYDYTHTQLVVGRPADNIVTLFRALFHQIYLPLVRK